MPVLWVVDVCAMGVVAGSWWAAAVLNHFQSFVDHQARQHAEQLDDMIERTNEIERVNDAHIERIERLEAELARQYRDLSDQISTLEAAADARRKVFETETRRISEHAYRLFQSQLENNASQLEAVHVAIQYQRAELRRLRTEIRELQMDVAPQRRLRSVEEATSAPALPGARSSDQPALFIESGAKEAHDARAIEGEVSEHDVRGSSLAPATEAIA
jgi:DNA repair exonuclease SbcCD ATPase subunit